MFLTNVKFDDLKTLHTAMTALVGAGEVLERAGLNPSFDLAPGFPMRIEIEAEMPGMPHEMKLDYGLDWQPPDGVQEPAVAPPQPDAPAPAATGKGDAWTDAEDARLVELMALHVGHEGKTRTVAYMAVAEALGRTLAAVQFRVKSVLKSRVDAAIFEALPADGSEAAFEGPPAEQPAPSSATVAAVPSLPQTPLFRHLGTVPRDSWTLKEDHELMDLTCAGWDMGSLSNEFGRPVAAIKQRFEQLTGQRTHKRDDVLAALSQMLQAQAA